MGECPTCAGKWAEVCSNAFHAPSGTAIYWPTTQPKDAPMTDVTQADREAAARAGLDMSRLNERDADALRQGGAWDEWSLVQAFARYRKQALATARAEIEALAERVKVLEATIREITGT